jgi:hypothetical protein
MSGTCSTHGTIKHCAYMRACIRVCAYIYIHRNLHMELSAVLLRKEIK